VVIGELKREIVLNAVEFGLRQRRVKFDVARKAHDFNSRRRDDLDTVAGREPTGGFGAQQPP
jgi:hypothetical protein